VSKFVHAGAFPERVPAPRNTGHLTLSLPFLKQRVQEGEENASLLWRELRERGFTGGYKMVNIWLREYLQQPGRQSSEREQARRRLFQLPPLPEASTERIRLQAEPHQQPNLLGDGVPEEPLPSPRRLVWLLLRNADTDSRSERELCSSL
jgi:transposase